MENNQIIEADFRPVNTAGECELNRITTEIRYITGQVNRALLTGIIEIGKRFDRAKSLVKHGQWGAYVTEATGYSQSMAENYITIYKEYGAEQQSLLGDLSTSNALSNLGITKLLQLTALPADEREEFVEENNVTEDTTVKELQELLKKKESEYEDAQMLFREKEQSLNASIRRNNDVISEKEAEIERLQKELKEMQTEQASASPDEMTRMMEEAKAEAIAENEKTIIKLQQEADKLRSDVKKQKERYDKLSKGFDERGKLIQELEHDTEEIKSTAAAEKEQLKKEIERLQKESMLGSNEAIVRLNMTFQSAQDSIRAVKEALDMVKDGADYEKLKTVISKTLTTAAEEISK